MKHRYGVSFISFNFRKILNKNSNLKLIYKISLLNTFYENTKYSISDQNQPFPFITREKEEISIITMPPTKRCFRETHPRMQGELIAAGTEYKRVAASGVPTCVEREPSAVGKVWAGWGCRAFSGGEGSPGRVRALWRRLSARRGGIAVVAAVTIRSSVSQRVASILSQDIRSHLVVSRTRVRVFFHSSFNHGCKSHVAL